MLAVNDPSLLHNPFALLAGIFAFFGFVLMWCNKHAGEIEAEDWQPLSGQDLIAHETEPTSSDPEQKTPRR